MRRQVSHHPAIFEIHHPAGKALDLAQVVAAKNKGGAAVGKGSHQAFNLALGGRVQAGCGLVQQHHSWLAGPGARQRNALLLTA